MRIVDILTDEEATFLRLHKLYTAEDFLLVTVERSKQIGFSFQRLKQVQDEICEAYCHSPTVSELTAEQEYGFVVLSSGCAALDDLLRGGIATGEITELVGPSSVGKTQLCLMASACCAKGGSVVYLDTSNSFKSTRVREIFRARYPDQNNDTCSKAISSIRCCKVYSIDDARKVLEKLQVELRSGRSRLSRNLKLIVVDLLSGIMSPILGGKNNHIGHALMTSFAHLLKSIKSEFHIAVVTTAHTVSTGRGDEKPSLGLSWTYFADNRLYLMPQSSGKYTATLLKSSKAGTGRSIVFQITTKGLESRQG